jgi:hypothetical protein
MKFFNLFDHVRLTNIQDILDDDSCGDSFRNFTEANRNKELIICRIDTEGEDKSIYFLEIDGIRSPAGYYSNEIELVKLTRE